MKRSIKKNRCFFGGEGYRRISLGKGFGAPFEPPNPPYMNFKLIYPRHKRVSSFKKDDHLGNFPVSSEYQA